jgi:hypothetical protein
VVGPLAAYVDPHSWDLCETHAARLVVPRGWDVVRLPADPAQERADDLEALANIVREPGRAAGQGGRGPQGLAGDRRQAPAPGRPGAPPRSGAQPAPAGQEPVGQGVETGRRGHLRVVRSAPVQPEP